MRFAVITNGVVENVVVWDGQGGIFSEYQTVQIMDDMQAAPGWGYVNSVFIPPAVPEKTTEQLISEAFGKKEALLNTANARIIVWHTKLLAGVELSDSDRQQLNLWLNYIDAVQAVDARNAPDISWPALPVA